nr:hypothetical protein [Sphingobium yanoikuyae]
MIEEDPLRGARYVELQTTTHFSFLRGASSPEELFAAAAMLGLPALGVVDRNSFGGAVRAWMKGRLPLWNTWGDLARQEGAAILTQRLFSVFLSELQIVLESRPASKRPKIAPLA